MTRLTSHLEKLALETFSVVLGIILAFAANSWHDRRAHEESACEALNAIRAELTSNDSLLSVRVPYHAAMRDSMTALLKRTRGHEALGGLQAIKNWNGLMPTRLLDDAWQTARSTQALQYLPFDLVIGLSRAYAYQQQIADANRGLLAAVYTPAFATGGVGAVAAMYSFLDDLASNEQHLREELDAEVPRTKQYCASR